MPFGTEISPPVIEDHYRFTGRERDTESGLDYFGARYYASSMGRWMSPDWSEKVEAVPHAVLTNPQSLNLYQYGLDRDPTSSETRECSVMNSGVNAPVHDANVTLVTLSMRCSAAGPTVLFSGLACL